MPSTWSAHHTSAEAGSACHDPWRRWSPTKECCGRDERRFCHGNLTGMRYLDTDRLGARLGQPSLHYSRWFDRHAYHCHCNEQADPHQHLPRRDHAVADPNQYNNTISSTSLVLTCSINMSKVIHIFTNVKSTSR